MVVFNDEFFQKLEYVYNRYTLRDLVHPDPLEFLYGYPDIRDREIVGLLASSLAYGRVAQILKSVRRVLTPMEDSPFNFLMSSSESDWEFLYDGFKHRFTTSCELIQILSGLKQVLKIYGSLDQLMYVSQEGRGVVDGLSFFVHKIRGFGKNSMLPSPSDGSSCKRLMLYTRWMVRSDEVDPGGWDSLDSSDLIVPLDTHMYNICKKMGLISRKGNDLKSAIEATDSFKVFCPSDPVKYDFSLTRFGIRDDMKLEDLFNII